MSNMADILEDVQTAFLMVDGTGSYKKNLNYPDRFEHTTEIPAFGEFEDDGLKDAPMQWLHSDETEIDFINYLNSEATIEFMHIIRIHKTDKYGKSLADRKDVADYKLAIFQALKQLLSNIKSGTAKVDSRFVDKPEQMVVEFEEYMEVNTLFTLAFTEEL